MRLVNNTRWPAILQVANQRKEDLAAVVVVKRTFDIAADGRLFPAEEPMPITPDFLETPYGIFHGDHFFRKRGADVAILGTLRRPRPITSARISVTVGSTTSELRILGDRHWRRSGHAANALSPSAPAPFTEMPLSYKRAYGGTAEYAGHQAPHAENPWGTGFYLTAEQAVDHPLANIEDAAAPERYLWSDRIPVAGVAPYPMIWALRAQQAVTIGPDQKSIQSVSPLLFNNAHPKLIVDKIAPRDTILIHGLAENILAIMVPSAHLRVQVAANGRTSMVDSQVDGVFVWSDAGKVVVSSRAIFRYQFQPQETRQATLSESDA